MEGIKEDRDGGKVLCLGYSVADISLFDKF
jgi:hypothetical protein